MKEDEIKEMAVSGCIVLFVVFFATLLLVGVLESAKLALFYVLIFHLPFLPLAYSFKELNFVEKTMFSNIMGISYVGLYATLDEFLKIKLNLFTYLAVTLIIFFISFWIYSKKR